MSRGQGGQALVETALVLPLYVFLLLGLLQLGLMHQARLMTKYAAYKAVRAGVLHSADPDAMERAALAALLPLVSRKVNGVERITPVAGFQAYIDKWRWNEVQSNRIAEAPELKLVQATICGPLTGDLPSGPEVDFDDPANAGAGNWRGSQKTKLRVQILFNYRMPIPFASWMFHAIASGRAVSSAVFRGAPENAAATRFLAYQDLADQGVYVLPIRANYTMRMQSNLFRSRLPDENECQLPFAP